MLAGVAGISDRFSRLGVAIGGLAVTTAGIIADFADFETVFVVLSSGLVVGVAVLVRSARR